MGICQEKDYFTSPKSELHVQEFCQFPHVSADDSCLKLPLRGVWIRPTGESTAASPPPGKRSLPQTPRSESFYHVVSADRAA
jgi:hypothetical protein